MNKLNFVGAALALFAVAADAQNYRSFMPVTHDFIKAVRDRNGDKLNELLATRRPGLVDARADNGDTPLTITIARSDEEWTAFLLGRGADPNLPGKGGDTPLIVASRVGSTEAIRLLMRAGAKVNQTNRIGETPLIVAVQQRQLPAVRALLEAGADPDITDGAAGLSARDYAARDNRSRQMLQLIEAKRPKPPSASR